MELDQSVASLALANAVVFAASFVMATTGLGFALIAVPILALIDLDYVPGPTLLVNIFLVLFMLGQGGSKIVQRELAILCPAIAIGTLIGAAILRHVPAETLGTLFAVLILLAVAVTLFAKPHRLT